MIFDEVLKVKKLPKDKLVEVMLKELHVGL